MTTVAPAPASQEAAPRRWTVEEFERLPDDIFPEGERAELIDGQIYTKMSQNDPHVYSVYLVTEALRAAFGPDFSVLSQSSLRLGEGDKPEPDLAVVQGRLKFRQGERLDLRSRLVLVVEVSDTTLRRDQTLKASLYARQGVPEYWIVNLQNRTLEVRRRPRGDAYAETVVFGSDERVAVGGGEVAVAGLLPDEE